MSRFKQFISENWLALTIILLASIVFCGYEIQAYRKFLFPLLDLGLYNRHSWSLVRFDFSANPLKGFNLLGDHAHFILFLLTPIYVLFQSPLTLLIIQALAISLSGWPIYLIAKKYNNLIPSLWLVPYYLYFGFAAALDFPFHVAPLATLPLSWALYFLLDKKFKALFPVLLILMIIKEDMPLLLIMMGLYLIIINRKYWLGIVTIITSAIYFIFVTRYFLPHFNPAMTYSYSNAGELGANWNEVLVNALHQPLRFLRELFSPLVKIKSVVAELSSFGFLSLLAPEILVLILPLWLGRFLSIEGWRWTSFQHYSATQGPILMVAAIIGVSRLSHYLAPKINAKYVYSVAFVLMIAGSIFINIKLPQKFFSRITSSNFYHLNSTEQAAQKALDIIPSDASVGAATPFPQLSSRKNIYNLPLSPGNNPQFVIISPALDPFPFGSATGVEQYMQALLQSQNYQTIFQENGVFVLKKI